MIKTNISSNKILGNMHSRSSSLMIGLTRMMKKIIIHKKTPSYVEVKNTVRSTSPC